mmetsp:Transcript_150310/g.418814  ORF Transcript_150310/g.418814 Transcript_150310/m.418814 type:complete len:273 (+) Transcript_150310:1213-2031(+)
MFRSSWFPRTNQTRSGSSTLSERSKPTTSNWWSPRSTKSPLNTNEGASCWSGLPKAQKNINKSRNWPWRSPKILQGTVASATGGCTESILTAARVMRIKLSRYCVLNKWMRRSSEASHSESSLSCSLATCFASFRAWPTMARARWRTDCNTAPFVSRGKWYFLRCMALSATWVKARTRARSTFPIKTPQRASASCLVFERRSADSALSAALVLGRGESDSEALEALLLVELLLIFRSRVEAPELMVACDPQDRTWKTLESIFRMCHFFAEAS